MKQGNSLVTLVIVLLAVMLAAYLGVYAWDSFTDPFTTTLTYSYTANDSLEADGWVVREEQLLPAQSGILDITRAEGEEVGRGQTVALVHQNSQALDVQAQMEELAMEIELLDYAMNQTDDVVSAARLDESILQSLASLRFASASGSYRQLDDDVMELKSQVLKRSYTYGEGLDSSQLSALRQSLIEEYRALRTQSSSVTSRITAPAAGVFSSLADGYESLLTPQSILTMTPADLDALAGQQVTAPSGTAGKLITSDRWYFAAAQAKYPEGEYLLGFCYLNGIGVPPDPELGVFWISEGAKGGFPEAMGFFGSLLVNGKLGDEMKKDGIPFLEKAAAANDPYGTLNLGLAYLSGTVIALDREKGKALVKKAADLGSDDAASMLESLA